MCLKVKRDVQFFLEEGFGLKRFIQKIFSSSEEKFFCNKAENFGKLIH